MSQSVDKNILSRFYQDEELYDEIQAFFLAHLDQLALSYVYEKKDTVGIADAKLVIENAFKQLEEIFGEKEKPKKPKNEAR